jgi:hypothetical protein
LGLKGARPLEDDPGLRDFLLAQARQCRRFALMIEEFEIMAGNPAFDAYSFSSLRALADPPPGCRLGDVSGSRRPLKGLCDATASKPHRFGTSSA